jgi:DNA-binding MltR family transcriptional regulator
MPGTGTEQDREARVTEALTRESDRGCVLLGAAMLDEALELLIRAACRPDEAAAAAVRDLFEVPYAPLRSLSAKAHLAFSLGLVTAQDLSTITLIRKLRNEFAHGYDHLDFNSPGIEQRVRLLIADGKPKRRDEAGDELVDLHGAKVKRGELVTRLAFIFAVVGVIARLEANATWIRKANPVHEIIRRIEQRHSAEKE